MPPKLPALRCRLAVELFSGPMERPPRTGPRSSFSGHDTGPSKPGPFAQCKCRRCPFRTNSRAPARTRRACRTRRGIPVCAEPHPVRPALPNGQSRRFTLTANPGTLGIRGSAHPANNPRRTPAMGRKKGSGVFAYQACLKRLPTPFCDPRFSFNCRSASLEKSTV
jgi:hypothetical protein